MKQERATQLGINMTKPRVPDKFYFKNSAGGKSIYMAQKTATGSFEVTWIAGERSGLNSQSMHYSRAACWGYLFSTGEWERVPKPKPEPVKAPAPVAPSFEMKVQCGKDSYRATDFKGAYEILALLKSRDKVEGKLEAYRT